MTARCALYKYIVRRCVDMAIRNYPRSAILNLFESKIAPLDPPSQKTPPYNQTWSGSDDRLRRYGHLKFIQDGGGGRHLGFVRTGNSAIRSAVPKNPPPYNQTWSGSDDRLRTYGHLKFIEDGGDDLNNVWAAVSYGFKAQKGQTTIFFISGSWTPT